MAVVLDPDAEAVLAAARAAGRPAYETISADEARAFYLQARLVANPEPPELANVSNTTVPGPAEPIPVRVYIPLEPRLKDGLAPGVMFFHGGGWVIGNLESHDVVCRTLASESGAIVVSVDYRLAPEHKFPAAYDDCVAATDWIAKNATQFRIDMNRFFVAGDSAGGNLAATVAIHAREHGPKITGQILIYPATDFRMNHPSHSEPETDCLLTHSTMRWFADHYLNGPQDVADVRASPARVNDFSNLPPAYVLTAGADPLRDEGDEYAMKLHAAGVAVQQRSYAGQFHGFITMGKLLVKAGDALRDIATWIKAFG